MLNFSRIELRGFKSFADKVVIPFKEGVTAIIGPNGCGKSNVADAIRWTLGEQSAKQLRGRSMQDVIFSGTEKRRSMSYCEVSLVFDNTDRHTFPNVEFDEVIITRKLDRSGTSEYYINNSRVRMKDIISMLRDTGVGKEGYSIIGQGRVAEIMSAKPDERRQIFEEAAGISTFRSQRTEAEKKLEKAALNLQTADEVISEIEKRLVPLRKQAEVAAKYFELKAQLKSLEVNQYIYNFENNSQTKQKISQKLEKLGEELLKADAQYKQSCKDYDDRLAESQNIDKIYDENSAELTLLKVGEARLEGEAGIMREKIAGLQADIQRLNSELAETDSQLVISAQQLSNIEAGKEEAFAAYLRIKKEYEDVKAKLESVSRTLEGHESELDATNSEYLRAIEELGDLKQNRSAYETEKRLSEQRLQNLKELAASKQARLAEAKTECAMHDGSVSSMRERTRELMSAYNETVMKQNEDRETVKAYDDDILSLNSQLGLAEGRLALSMSIKNNYEGYQEGVKWLMKDAKNDPKLASEILGVIAEVIDVPDRFETAIEYALGGAMHHVLVENDRTAGDIIAYLKQKGYGRVTFRPLNSARPQSLSPADREALKEPGCFGTASSLLNYDKRFDGVIQTLLGSTVVVNNLDNAIRIYKKYNQNFRIVTLDGEIFTRGGEITGGSKRNQRQGLLSQEKQIEQAKANLEKIKKNIELFNAQRQEKLDEIEESAERLKQMSNELSNLRIDCSRDEEKLKQAMAFAEQLEAEIASDNVELEQVQATIASLGEKLKKADELERITNEKREEINALMAASKTGSSEQKSRREQLSEQAMQLRVQLATQKSALDSYDSENFRLTKQKEELEAEKLDIIAELKNRQAALESITSAPKKSTFSEEDARRIKELEKRIAEFSERKRVIADDLKSLEAQRLELTERKNGLLEQKIRNETMLANVDETIRKQEQHILEEYNLTYTDAQEFRDPEFKIHGSETAITDVKKSISRLGDVNLLAQEDLKETEERLNVQVTHRDDILKAIDDIKSVISNLTGQMKDLFIDAFDKINENFKVVFRMLFGGGKAELRLSKDTDDVLEAGIEIYAQPPGKKLQNISLFSGGEQALTAISILFAILKLKPMPFCVLDEIEAALDDNNVNLFAEFLKKFSDFTQFIVITHRKPTMRHADSIFGVTMEEKGVTKIVSIEFEDAVKQVADQSE